MQEDKISEKKDIKEKKKRTLLQRLVRITLLILVLSVVIPVIAIQLPLVQTWVVHKVSEELSSSLDADISVEHIDLSLFGKVIVKNIHVSDLERDTLITVGKLTAKINSIPVFGRPLSFGNLELYNGGFTLRTDEDGANISKLLAKLIGKDKGEAKTKSKFRLETNSLRLYDFKYRMLLNNALTKEEQPYGIIYKNMSVDSINLNADKISFRNDTIFFKLNSLSLSESSGFNLQRLSSDQAYVAFGKEVNLQNLVIVDDYSNVYMKQFKMEYAGIEDFKDFVNKVKLYADLEKSIISFKSIGIFAPVLRNVDISAMLDGLISGTVANLKSNNLEIQALNKTRLKGNFSINGLPNIETTTIYARLTKLVTDKNDVVNALEGITSKDWSKVNTLFSELGFIDFTGTFTGLINDFVAHGRLITELGTLNMDLQFSDNQNIKGQVIAKEVNLGKFLKTDIIGTSNFNVMVNGTVASPNLNIFSKGTISNIIINNYSYNNISLSGTLANSKFNGDLSINDQNINLDFAGEIDLEGDGLEKTPIFNFTSDIRHINFVNLNFNRRDSISEFKGKIEANFKGRNILDYVGDIKVFNSSYKDNFGELDLGDITLTSVKMDTTRSELKLLSKFAEVSFIGSYDIGRLIGDMGNLALIYFPVFNSGKAVTALENKSKDSYSLKVKTKGELLGVERIIDHRLSILPNTALSVDMDYGNVNIKLKSEGISFKNNSLSGIDLHVYNTDSIVVSNVYSTLASVGSVKFNNLSIESTSKKNKIYTHASFGDNATRRTGTDLYFDTEIKNNEEKNKKEAHIQIKDSKLYILGEEWDINKSFVTIDNSGIKIDGFKIQKDIQNLFVAGSISKEKTDALNISLDKFGLNTLNYFTEKKGYSLGGVLSGNMSFSDAYNNLKLDLNLNLDSVLVNKDTLGNIIVASVWDTEQERLDVTSRIYNSEGVRVSINGYYEPRKAYLRFDAKLNKLKVNYISPLLRGILSNINGYMDGDISLIGKINDPKLGGKVNLNNVGLTVDYLQTRYLVNSTVNINENSFIIKDGTLTDTQEHQGTLNVEVHHEKFKNITFNSLATVNNMHSLNTKENDNHLFYGSAYATGGIRLRGNPKEFNFDITARADDNSILYIPLSNSTVAKKASFLTFKKRENEVQEILITKKKSNIDLNLDLLLTPGSEIQILIDPKVGDILKAKGQGNLKIKVSPENNIFDIVGDYEIEKGEYNFSLPKFSILSRKFNIEKGSHIKFNGDISSAVLNVTATYKERVSLSSLIPHDSTYRRYNVNCNIFITGQLTNPNLKFELDFPDLEPEKKSIVQSVLNTEEKVTRQFLTILLTKTMIPEQDYGQSDLGSSVLLGNASELLSSQIGELISLFNLPVPIDVNLEYSPDGRNYGKTNYDIDISTQLFDRVILSGTASSTSQANRSFAGDFEAEVMVGKQGNLRFKAFTKSHDYFSGDLESNRQGVGISYQGQFKKFKDIFIPKKTKEERKKSREKKREEKMKAKKAKEAIREKEVSVNPQH